MSCWEINLQYSKYGLILFLFALFAVQIAHLSPAVAQSASPVTYTVGWAVVKPSIDGVVEPGEWNYSNELQITQTPPSGGVTCNGGAYLRLTHDNSSLYGLVDVVADDGSKWSVGNRTYTGSIAFLFDGNNDGFQTEPEDYIVGFSPGYTTASVWSKSFSNFTSQVVAKVVLGPSPHYRTAHRIYEFSIPLQPLIMYASSSNHEIGFDLVVAYPPNGECDLMGSSGLPAKLVFDPTAVPEHIDLVIPLMLILVCISFRKRKLRRLQTS